MRVKVAVVVCLLVGLPLGGSGVMRGQAALPTVAELLPKIYAYAAQYRATLPSLECDESIVSQRVAKGKVKWEVKWESRLREVRTDGGKDPFAEHHQFLSLDGKAAPEKFKVPYFVQGGFANAIGFASREDPECYDYVVTAGPDAGTVRLDLVVRAQDADAACRVIPEGYKKSVVVEAATGRVEFVERSMSAKAAAKLKEVPNAAVTYGPEKLGDAVMWLPVQMVAHDDRDEGRMTARYSNFHRYTATVTIEP